VIAGVLGDGTGNFGVAAASWGKRDFRFRITSNRRSWDFEDGAKLEKLGGDYDIRRERTGFQLNFDIRPMT
jgi:hypothetical protein